MTPEEQIERALEHRLNPDEWKRLQADIIADPELRAAYVERSWLHAQLTAEGPQLPELLNAEPTSPVKTRQRVRTVYWAAAAAAIAIVATLWISPNEQKEEWVATLVQAEDCRWAGSDLPTAEGAQLGKGKLALVEGMATLRFESGAEITLEAPSTLEVLSKMRCRLIEGSLVANVPDSAHGFTIDTEEMEVIDLGTRFGLTASGLGKTHLYVFDGVVEVEREDEARKRLVTGEALVHGIHAPVLDQEVERIATPIESEDGWLSIPTTFGNGKDAYVRQGDSDNETGDHPLLMVKSTDFVPTNVRHAYLAFDISQANPGSIADAELTLQVRSSGLGFSTLVPDSRFAVYGIADNSWDERSLLWENAPASNLEGVEKLAEFEIPKGSPVSQVSARSPELSSFIRNQPNGLVSFVVIRETGELEKQGLVHAFASKEHPTAQAPTLKLKMENDAL